MAVKRAARAATPRRSPRPRGPSRDSASTKASPDVLIVGGGVMGCASALALADAGLSVEVLERSIPGAEASSAAAGMLAPQSEAHAPGPMTDLMLASRKLYPAWVHDLERRTHIALEYREAGSVRVGLGRAAVNALIKETAWQHHDRRLGIEVLDRAGVRELEPNLTSATGGVFFPKDGRVDPRRLLQSLHVAATQAGVRFTTGVAVQSVDVESGTARGVALGNGSRLRSAHVVVAAGSWTPLVDGLPLPRDAVSPARGQVIELITPLPATARVVFGPRCYAVPRDDGRLLVGSTLEFVGYRREVTAGAMRELLDAAIELLPSLRTAQVGRTWSNFRPFTGDHLPILGPTSIRGLTLATGHYRTGILLAPITARVVEACVVGRRPPLPLSPFSAARISAKPP